jgi:hypothetical protein
VIDRYDDLIRQNDHAIGKLIAELKQLAIYEETLLGITGDHGEAFGENGVFGHATVPWEEVVHVPLILKLPTDIECDNTVPDVVEHVDLVPTILDAWDINPDHINQGESLLNIIHNEHSSNGTAFTYTNLRSTSPEYISFRASDWKYMKIIPPKVSDIFSARSLKEGILSWYRFNRMFGFIGNKELLYKVQDGCVNENRSLVDENPDVCHDLKQGVTNVFEECDDVRNKIHFDANQKVGKIDDDTRDQLEGMGYL